MKKISLLLILVVTLFASASSSLAGPQAVVWPEIQFGEIVGGLSRPVQVTSARDGSGRLFIVEQDGQIQIYKNHALNNTPFLDIRGRVLSPADMNGGTEEGLLALAFPPGFGAGKDYLFVYYTNLDGNNQLSRFYLGGPDQAMAGSEELILQFPHPNYTNHNGAALAFGPDGYLYISTGDGGGSYDPMDNAQSPDSLLGKLLRIDTEMEPPDLTGLDTRLYLPFINRSTGVSTRYRVPEDNPFFGLPGYLGEIWALGLRNPWRFSFDRLTGDLYLGDVGQLTYEEINYQSHDSTGGQDYGWDDFEATTCPPPGSPSAQDCSTAGRTMPVYYYPHTNDNLAVTGGHIYRGAAHPTLSGIYFFGDYASGRVWGMQRDGSAWVVHDYGIHVPGALLSSFGEDDAGEIYFTARNTGVVYRLRALEP